MGFDVKKKKPPNPKISNEFWNKFKPLSENQNSKYVLFLFFVYFMFQIIEVIEGNIVRFYSCYHLSLLQVLAIVTVVSDFLSPIVASGAESPKSN